jgi:hypothetical protein
VQLRHVYAQYVFHYTIFCVHSMVFRLWPLKVLCLEVVVQSSDALLWAATMLAQASKNGCLLLDLCLYVHVSGNTLPVPRVSGGSFMLILGHHTAWKHSTYALAKTALQLHTVAFVCMSGASMIQQMLQRLLCHSYALNLYFSSAIPRQILRNSLTMHTKASKDVKNCYIVLPPVAWLARHAISKYR